MFCFLHVFLHNARNSPFRSQCEGFITRWWVIFACSDPIMVKTGYSYTLTTNVCCWMYDHEYFINTTVSMIFMPCTKPLVSSYIQGPFIHIFPLNFIRNVSTVSRSQFYFFCLTNPLMTTLRLNMRFYKIVAPQVVVYIQWCQWMHNKIQKLNYKKYFQL